MFAWETIKLLKFPNRYFEDIYKLLLSLDYVVLLQKQVIIVIMKKKQQQKIGGKGWEAKKKIPVEVFLSKNKALKEVTYYLFLSIISFAICSHLAVMVLSLLVSNLNAISNSLYLSDSNLNFASMKSGYLL